MKLFRYSFILLGFTVIVSTSCTSEYAASSTANFPELHLSENINYSTLKAAYSSELVDTSAMIAGEESLLPKVIEQESIETEIEEQKIIQNQITYLYNVLLTEAKSYLGTRYRLGGSTRNGIDCSAFTQNSFGAIGVTLPRTASSQSELGTYVDKGNVQAGDLLFFHTKGRYVSHVAIVERVEQNLIYFIHASSSKGVTISTLNDSYWSSRFLFAKRIEI